MSSLAPQEKTYYDQLFGFIDKDSIGILPGQDAYPFLTSSKLQTATLGEIWALADPENNGFLTRDAWYKAARLIGWMQNGHSAVEEGLVHKPGPLPAFEQGPKPPQETGTQPLSASPTGSLPPLTPADRAKFTRLFAGAGPHNGLLSGDKARDMFIKSNLPYDKLGQIWNLADTQDRGSLDLTDFIVGMHLIQSCMTNSSLNLPSALPPGLYETASGGRKGPPTSPISRQNTGTNSPVRPQYTGAVAPLQQQGTGSSLQGRAPSRQFTAPATGSTAPWDVTAQAKATSDAFFTQLDPQGRGVIQGEVAVPFMLQSQLDEASLANIWDLADIRKEGKLTRDEFAVAMHLINAKLGGQPVPTSLPISLVPPSLRDEFAGKQQVLASAPTGVSKDLFDLFADDEPAPAKTASPVPAPQAQAPALPTRSPSNDQQPFQASTAFLGQPPAPPARRQVSASASRTLSPNPTGQAPPAGPTPFGTTFSSSPVTSPAAKSRDLLSDEAQAGHVPDHSAEFGNKQNQLGNTARALDDLSAQRTELSAQDASSREEMELLEDKLRAAREKHSSELRAVADLRVRVGEQQAKGRNLNSELITTSSDLSALQSEKSELEQTLLSLKEDIRGLQRQMKEAEDEKAGLLLVLEKLRKEARQQKGLVSIARKQLQTAQGARDGAAKEADGVREEIESEKAELDRLEQEKAALSQSQAQAQSSRGVFSPERLSTATSVPLPATPTPQALSPAITGRSNNPFDRFRSQPGSATSPGATPTQQNRQQGDNEASPFDAALFGVGAAAAGAAGAVAAAGAGLYEAAVHAVGTEDDRVDQASRGGPGVETPALDDAEVGHGLESAAPEAAAEKQETGTETEHKEETDPFGASVSSSVHETDPFGAPATSTPQPRGLDSFGDGFGDSFGSAPQESFARDDKSAQPESGFDNAFAEMGDRPQEAGAEGIPSGIPKSTLAVFAGDRPEAERSLSTQAEAPETPMNMSAISTPGLTESGQTTPGAAGTPSESGGILGSAVGAVGAAGAAVGAALGGLGVKSSLSKEVGQDDGGDSSDDDQGPEDLEGPKREYGDQHTPGLESKTRRSAPPPPSAKSPPAMATLAPEYAQAPNPVVAEAGGADIGDAFDPFGAPVSVSAPNLAPGSVATASALEQHPKMASFDEDDFDFSDLPPAQVDATASAVAPSAMAGQGQAGHGFDDEFASFDDEFETPQEGGSAGSELSSGKSYEMVSPLPQVPETSAQPDAGGLPRPGQQARSNSGLYDEWGFGTTKSGKTPEVSGQGEQGGFGFDDAFGDFDPSAQPQAQSSQQGYAPPPGSPPAQNKLVPPSMPERRPSAAQQDDIEDVKKLCAMGFPRGLVVEALAANAYDFQKTLNVLLS